MPRRVLVISHHYPSAPFPALGVWAERLTMAAMPYAEPTVLSAVPWTPPIAVRDFARWRAVPHREVRNGITVHHPRVPVPPGYLLHGFDARLSYPTIRRAADALHEQHRFELIHAHFIYPDGVIAAKLGHRWGIPVVTTEHSHWTPWLDRYPRVKKQVLQALGDIAVVGAVSEPVRAGIRAFTGRDVRVEVLPNVVDDVAFPAPAASDVPDPDRLLFVGAIRHVKGVDVLLRALAKLVATRPALHLDIVGQPFLHGWQKDEREVRALLHDLSLSERVRFLGALPPGEIGSAMRSSALLVVPSRRESFSVVAAEAIASGTPVVATRCGGPEDIVTDVSGVLVTPDNDLALAAGIAETLDRRASMDRMAMRAEVVGRFGWAASRARIAALYASVLPTAPTLNAPEVVHVA